MCRKLTERWGCGTRRCDILVGLGTGADTLHAQAVYGVPSQPVLNGALWERVLKYMAQHGAAPQVVGLTRIPSWLTMVNSFFFLQNCLPHSISLSL